MADGTQASLSRGCLQMVKGDNMSVKTAIGSLFAIIMSENKQTT